MSHTHATVDDALLQRVYAEFLEMPGLRLTCQQAERLWGLDTATCLTLLEFLVDAKFLCRPGHGMYTRLTDGYTARRRPRMATARLEDDMASVPCPAPREIPRRDSGYFAPVWRPWCRTTRNPAS